MTVDAAVAGNLVKKLTGIIEEYTEHQSVRCGWPAGYKQWRDGDCACGLTRALREAGLPVEWAGGPPEE